MNIMYTIDLLIKSMITRATTAQKPKTATIVIQRSQKGPERLSFLLCFAPACLMRIKRPGHDDQTVNHVAALETMVILCICACYKTR